MEPEHQKTERTRHVGQLAAGSLTVSRLDITIEMTWIDYEETHSMAIESGCPGGKLTVLGFNSGFVQIWRCCDCFPSWALNSLLIPFRIVFGLLFGSILFALDIVVTLFWALTFAFCCMCKPTCPWVGCLLWHLARS